MPLDDEQLPVLLIRLLSNPVFQAEVDRLYDRLLLG